MSPDVVFDAFDGKPAQLLECPNCITVVMQPIATTGAPTIEAAP